jgi:hypothetical protein
MPPLLPALHRPIQRISIDIVGLLPLTERGNKFIVTCMDHFTRWPKAVPLPDQKARTVAQPLAEHVICRYEYPQEILTDFGSPNGAM